MRTNTISTLKLGRSLIYGFKFKQKEDLILHENRAFFIWPLLAFPASSSNNPAGNPVPAFSEQTHFQTSVSFTGVSYNGGVSPQAPAYLSDLTFLPHLLAKVKMLPLLWNLLQCHPLSGPVDWMHISYAAPKPQLPQGSRGVARLP